MLGGDGSGEAPIIPVAASMPTMSNRQSGRRAARATSLSTPCQGCPAVPTNASRGAGPSTAGSEGYAARSTPLVTTRWSARNRPKLGFALSSAVRNTIALARASSSPRVSRL